MTGSKKIKKREYKGFLFLLPSFAGVCLFWVIPYLDVIRRSFFSAISGEFTGLKNYSTIFENQAFRLAAGNTLRFFLVCIPLLVVLSLMIAVLLTRRKKSMQALKSMFLLPMAIPVASVVLLWKVLFHDQGLLNHFLETLSLQGVDWMNTDASFWVLVVSYLWRNLGYDIVLWVAGLSAISQSLYEAARVDGAGNMRQFFSITLPMLKPITYLVVTLGTIWSFQVFDLVYTLTGGGPGRATTTLVLTIYNSAFKNYQMGYASAVSMLLLAVVLVISFLQKVVFREKD